MVAVQARWVCDIRPVEIDDRVGRLKRSVRRSKQSRRSDRIIAIIIRQQCESGEKAVERCASGAAGHAPDAVVVENRVVCAGSDGEIARKRLACNHDSIGSDERELRVTVVIASAEICPVKHLRTVGADACDVSVKEEYAG